MLFVKECAMLIKLLTCIGLFSKIDHTRSSAVKKASQPRTPTHKFKNYKHLDEISFTYIKK